MKSYPDRLKELPIEILKKRIDGQKKWIKIAERDLDFMERALTEKAREEQ